MVASPSQRLLAVATGRLAIGVFILWLFRSVLVNLSFVEGLVIPDIAIAVAEIISFLFYLVMLILLGGYAQTLREVWPRAFPRLAALGPVLVALIYVLALSASYRALATVVSAIADDPDVVTLLRVSLVVIALVIVASAWLSFYQALPELLRAVRLEARPAPQETE